MYLISFLLTLRTPVTRIFFDFGTYISFLSFSPYLSCRTTPHRTFEYVFPSTHKRVGYRLEAHPLRPIPVPESIFELQQQLGNPQCPDLRLDRRQRHSWRWQWPQRGDGSLQRLSLHCPIRRCFSNDRPCRRWKSSWFVQPSRSFENSNST